MNHFIRLGVGLGVSAIVLAGLLVAYRGTKAGSKKMAMAGMSISLAAMVGEAALRGSLAGTIAAGVIAVIVLVILGKVVDRL